MRYAAAVKQVPCSPHRAQHLLCTRVLKLLSEDPGNYKDAPREGIRRLLEEFSGSKLPRDKPVDTTRIAAIRMGTTVRAASAAEPVDAGGCMRNEHVYAAATEMAQP